MHRIRYYKINQKIVWDRIQKYDILTGGDIHQEMFTSIEKNLFVQTNIFFFE
jgi:hypothetical protein